MWVLSVNLCTGSLTGLLDARLSDIIATRQFVRQMEVGTMAGIQNHSDHSTTTAKPQQRKSALLML
jgi:hypothetical protein